MSENENNEPQPKEQFDAFRIVGDPSALFTALAAAQGAFPSLEKGKTAEVQLKDGKGKYTFSYADLAALQKALRPALSANGISLIQPFFDCGQGFLIRTILAGHGARIEADCYCSREGRIQELGSALMYLRRYQFKGMTGFEADGEDDDGNAADGNTANIRPTNPPRSQPTPPAPKKATEARKPPQPDPQMQADIDRRKRESEERAASELSDPRSPAEKLAEAKAALAQAEESQGVAPAVVSEKTPSQYPAAPAADALPDSHVPDNVQLPKGAATREAMRRALNGAGIIESAEMAAKVLAVTGVDPRLNPLNYGNARAVLAALAAQ